MPKGRDYFVDDRLVPRIKQILRSRGGRGSALSITEELQAQFGEYDRKKKNMFLKSVERGFSIAAKDLQKEGIIVTAQKSSSSDSESEQETVLYEDKNIMNSLISNMYKSNNKDNEKKETPVTNTEGNTQQAWFIDRGKGKSESTPKRKKGLSNGLEKSEAPEDFDELSLSRPKRRRKDSPDMTRKKKKERQVIHPTVNFSSVGGNESILQHLQERCHFLEYPELLPKIKGDLPKSFLFHGPTGCGKTLLANAIAGEYQLPLLGMTATEVVGGISGDSEANIRDLFDQAAVLAPCVLLIDDVDAIATKRENATKNMESRLVTQLSNSMDDLRAKNLPVLVICATNRPNTLDEAFRRTGRFDIEYALRFPNRDARKSILEAICQGVSLSDNVSLSEIADLTPGYVGCDLKTLVSITNACALNRVISQYLKEGRGSSTTMTAEEEIKEEGKRQKVQFTATEIENFEIKVSKADFQKAMTEVKPTAKQEDVLLVPNTTWDDIGALDNIRKKLNLCIMAVANEAGINFLYIKGAELLNKYVGESEKNVRDLFKRASSLAPCVIFFDEIDSICPRRSSGSDENSTSRVTNQLLLEMSGLEQRTEVYVIAATNRLDRLDKAFLRPGRMDKIIYVGLPSPEGRAEILKALTKNGTRPKLSGDVDLERIGKDKRCEGFSGADLGNLLQVAKESCLEEIIESTSASEPSPVPVVRNIHFETAFESVSASVDNESKRNYDAVKRLLEKKTARKDMAEIEADSQTEAGPSAHIH
ncbi:nuclear valosin-containing protein-like [Elysia marginata]|uniref:Nuclear valosin-containing protein-like n=1 Tax=Elysia marginata TaxID=1093978 RepID=A0AAV4GAA2_9GAST|nr:nuclear valosin-containing protein-like [Elysia marginata]